MNDYANGSVEQNMNRIRTYGVVEHIDMNELSFKDITMQNFDVSGIQIKIFRDVRVRLHNELIRCNLAEI